MKTRNAKLSTQLTPLVVAWLALVLLTLISLGLGEWLRGLSWLPLLVASIIWLKAWLVARYFLEAQLSHIFLRRVIWIFIAFAPVALVLTDHFGRRFAEWAQL